MACNSLLKKKRRRLHAGIAAYLEDRSPHLALVEPELLAHHYTEAALPQRAMAYRLLASERAMQRAAMAEAAADRKRGGEGKSVSVRVELGGRGILKKKKKKQR